MLCHRGDIDRRVGSHDIDTDSPALRDGASNTVVHVAEIKLQRHGRERSGDGRLAELISSDVKLAEREPAGTRKRMPAEASCKALQMPQLIAGEHFDRL